MRRISGYIRQQYGTAQAALAVLAEMLPEASSPANNPTRVAHALHPDVSTSAACMQLGAT